VVLASLLFAAVALVGGGAPLDAPDLELGATRAGDLPGTTVTIGDLADGDVLLIDVTGFAPRSDAMALQCAWTGAARACESVLPVALDGRGHARFLVRLRDEVAGTSCREATRACVLVVSAGEVRAIAVTFFGGPARPLPELTVDDAAAARGSEVTATLEHLPPSASAAVALCSPGEGAPSCGPTLANLRADATGSATVSLTVGEGCAREQPCGLALVLAGDTEPVASTPFAVVGRSVALRYDTARLRIGVLAAVAFAFAAVLLLWRTDWTPVIADPFAGIELPDDPFAE
jgi:hypothetical protein